MRGLHVYCLCFVSIWLFCLNYLLYMYVYISFLCLFYVWLTLNCFSYFLICILTCMLSYTGGKKKSIYLSIYLSIYPYSCYNNNINPKQYRLQPVWARSVAPSDALLYLFTLSFKSFYKCEKVYNPTET